MNLHHVNKYLARCNFVSISLKNIRVDSFSKNDKFALFKHILC